MSALRPGEITLDPVRAQLRLLTHDLKRVEACGHAVCEATVTQLREREIETVGIIYYKCRDCGHTWKEVSP